MKLLRLSTQIHKWVALVIGLQVLFWVGGGLVMTAIPIETVRSEHRFQKPDYPAFAIDALIPMQTAAAGLSAPIDKAELRHTPRGPAWVFTPKSGEPVILSALDGKPFAAFPRAEALRLAQAAYRGEAQAEKATLFDEAPRETGREGPLWRVDFNDFEHTSFYLSPETGEVVTRRSGVWRFYDFFWRLHILDFKNGENFNHPTLIIITILTLSMVISGFILLWIKLARDWTVHRATRRKLAQKA
ncbi:PepSY domain-containing protein [Brevundimonas pondensis]|uniref:PepSY domain-containing protein n=1 Tax=Brevundimonas pondensis TaxID=2774189 RepID=UPI003207F5BB